MNLNLGDTQAIIAFAKSKNVLRNQLAYILATVYHETDRTMKPVREAYWLTEKWRKENLRYWPWYGRGYVQLTWESNYRAAGKKLNLDLTTDLDVVMRPEIAVPILITGAMQGWFTGKSIPDYITLSRSDFIGARRVINGTDKAAEIAEIAKKYDEALTRAGYGIEPHRPAVQPDAPVKPVTPPTRPKSGGYGGIAAAVVAMLAALVAYAKGWF